MIFYVPALILLVIAYFIKFKKVTWLVSGYNTSSKKSKEKYDLEKLCRLMGNFVFGLSFILFILASAMTLIPDQEEMLLLAGLAVLALYSLIGLLYLNTGRRVLKEE